jgi:hypothetical protein
MSRNDIIVCAHDIMCMISYDNDVMQHVSNDIIVVHMTLYKDIVCISNDSI